MDCKNLIYGVIVSLVAIFLWETFLFLKRLIHNFRLKSILGFYNRECKILAPIYPGNIGKEVIKYKNAYSFGHLFELLHKVNKEPELVPYHKQSENQDISDIIAIGSPISNKYVGQVIKDYNINFNMTKQEEINKFERPISKNKITGFKIGEKKFPASEKEEPAVIIKLTKNETGQYRTIFLIFGYSAQGTASAAYYLKKEYLRIYRKFKNKKFYILINVSRRESYKTYERNFIDLTEYF